MEATIHTTASLWLLKCSLHLARISPSTDFLRRTNSRRSMSERTGPTMKHRTDSAVSSARNHLFQWGTAIFILRSKDIMQIRTAILNKALAGLSYAPIKKTLVILQRRITSGWAHRSVRTQLLEKLPAATHSLKNGK